MDYTYKEGIMDKENTIPSMVDHVREGKMPRRHLIRVLTALGLSAGGISAIVASTIQKGETRPDMPVNTAADPATHLELHDQHIQYQGKGHTKALHQDYAEHAIVEDPMYPAPLVGRAAILARKTLGFAAVTDAQITILQRIANGNQVTVEWQATGLHTGDLPDLPATNRPYILHGVTVVIRQDGQIVRESLYYDMADLQKQLA
jgi:steroid delta-isomerase-like uncharacterized protein